MDQLFGTDPPKKPNQNTEAKEKYKNKEKKVKKNKAKKQQKQEKIIQEKKKEEKPEGLEIPLIIKLHHNLLETQHNEMSLEDFIQFMYPPGHKTNPKKQIIRSFQKEDDEGNIEYKLKLIKPTDDRLDHLATQMKFRVNEGSGQAYYRIGVEDDGKVIGLDKSQMYQSLKTICTVANKVRMDVTALKISEGIKGIIAELMIRKNQKQGIKLEIRLLLFGEPGSGKSTLLGVLTSGENDNGNGYTRSKVFTHKHQLMSGVTQTTTHHVIGFDSKGKLYNHHSMMSIQSWLQNSSKLLSFIDVGGHKEKQVVSSLCSYFPQYALWVISGTNVNLTTNNLELAKIFNLPLIVVITHLDKMSKEVEMQTVLKVKKILKELYKEKTASVIKQMQETVLFSRITSTQQVIPIFLISSVTGQNIELLINFFNLLTSVSELRNNEDLHSEFLISYKYIFDNNIVLAGTVIKGQIKKGQILHLGPDLKGTFRAVEVVSIQCMRVPVKIAKCGQLCTIGIKLLSYAKEWLQKEPNAIRRGMVLIDSKRNPKAAYEFSAQFFTYGNATQKISCKYEPVINTQTTRQICDIVIMNEEEIEHQEVVGSIKLLQKKSKSIDMGQKSKNHHNSSLSLLKNEGMELEKKKKKEQKIKHKQSVDVLDSEEVKKKKVNYLEPILQNKIKKKKQKDAYIYFDNKEPTTLRLRFKYYPQYLQIGQKLVINEMKLIGKVNKIFY